jgi:hypothetical protein
VPFDSLPPLPRILNLHHLRGKLIPPGAVYVGRGRDGIWGNDFEIGKDGTRAEVIYKHRQQIIQQPELMARLPELEGRDLVCWRDPEPCHACTLRWLANPKLRPRLEAIEFQSAGEWQPPASVPDDGTPFFFYARGRVRIGSLGYDLGGRILPDPDMTAWHPKVDGHPAPKPPPAHLRERPEPAAPSSYRR